MLGGTRKLERKKRLILGMCSMLTAKCDDINGFDDLFV